MKFSSNSELVNQSCLFIYIRKLLARLLMHIINQERKHSFVSCVRIGMEFFYICHVHRFFCNKQQLLTCNPDAHHHIQLDFFPGQSKCDIKYL